ncbi:hypothetical protein N7468_003868 [Penicillium chermesinum]|uniref:Cysteine-rich transmembrane CYSTM domain-containing protein n=1 Tax=Penicillium chermesinum TaxID=63820 RepID=A0A9W9P7H6_9EURO|nr:uncharacterized protein N7468_003868 [Penicillium chermesinum]KAJ5239249.1 hypothetical protein N7468_003868 [Penicillium chermesinum]KAJ6164880.1 hypothetical protein N7470_003552 [Penicillium chermesinum]
MFANGLFSWFSSPSKQEEAPATDATTIQAQQPTRPDGPSMDGASAQPKSEQEMNLRGGGGGDVCCGVCAGLLCFECCEDCC